MKRTINLKKTTREEILKRWGFPLPKSMQNPLYIRSNAAGEVNWDKASIYTEDELKSRKTNIIP